LSLRSARLAAVGASLLLALHSTVAGAAEIRVLVISAGVGDPVTPRLLDELVSLGMTVEVTPALEGDLAALGRARHAGAALRVATSRRAIDVWVDSGPDPDARQQHVEEPLGEPGDQASALALRAVESLRGRLLRIDAPPMPPSPPDPAPAATPQPPKPAHSDRPVSSASTPARPAAAPAPTTNRFRIALYLVPSVLTQPGGGLPAAGGPLVGGRWLVTRRVGGELLVLATVVPATIDAPEGAVRISGAVTGIGAWVDLLDPTLPLAMGAGAGIGAGFLNYDAEATTANVRGRDGTIGYVFPYAHSALSWHVLPPLGLRADVAAGVARPRPVIQIVGRDSDAVFGQPMLTLGVGLEVLIR